MPTVNLTAAFVRSIQPNGKRMDYFDEDVPGFSLRVSEKGVKTWCVSYRFAGKWTRYTFSNVTKNSLKEARDLAKDALRDAAKGINPAGKKKEARKADTFKELADAFMERYSKKKKKSWKGDQRIIDNKLNPKIGSVRAKELSRAQIREIVETIADNAPYEANRVLACLRKIYNWAISEDLVEANPCDHVAAPGEESRRDRVLTEDEIKIFWKDLENEQLPVASTFKMRLLTAQRGGEVLSVEWKELDLEGAWWTIPAEKAKNGLAHRVPLSPPAIRIFRELRRQQDESETRKESTWVFPARRFEGDNEHLDTVQKAVERIRERTRINNFRAHDLRRTAASLMTGMGIPRLTVQKILNHAEPGVTAVYDRHSYDKEKRDAIEAWNRRLMVIISDLQDVQQSEA
jgi:integrase